MRPFAFLLLIVLVGCSSNVGGTVGGTADARPIEFRTPPEPKEGSGTSPGCEGVTARGECREGTAVYCDLDRGRLRQVECEALNQNCIVDIGRGAICDTVEQDTGAGSGVASACSDTGISETGFCTSAGSAVYCDTTGTAPVTRSWNCGAEGMTCGVGACAEGAFCCGGSTSQGPDCGSIDYLGVCDGETATWCDPTDGLKTKACGSVGQRCEVDTCAFGAFCCGDVTPTGGMTEAQECAVLGYEGVCANNVARFCLGDELQEITCTGIQTCQENACLFGAGCCDPPLDNECTDLGYDGVCIDSTHLLYCEGVTDDDIRGAACGVGETCQENVCGDGAWCCPDVDPCQGLDAVGVCEGNTLKYCSGGNVTVSNCTTSGQSCEVNTCFPGFANCCD